MRDYSRIIDHPHYQSKKRPHMPMINRAAQFSAFAALSGYDEAVRETERTTSVRPLLAEDSISDIDRKLRFAVEMQEPVSVCYFVQDSSKDGGSYVTATGRVRKLNSFESSIMLEDGSRVALCDIIGISDGI